MGKIPFGMLWQFLHRHKIMANCAVVNQQTNLVENVIVADPENDMPPPGTFLVPIYWCDIGWYWVNSDTGFVESATSKVIV